MTLSEEIEDLTSVEDFFEHFDVDYDEGVMQHSRVKLLTLFNRSLAEYDEPLLRENYQGALSKAYCLLQHGVVVELSAGRCESCNSSC